MQKHNNPFLLLIKSKVFKKHWKKTKLVLFLCNVNFLEQDNSKMEKVLNLETQEISDPTSFTSLCSIARSTLKFLENSTLPIEINPNKFLHINPDLDEQQKADLIKILQQQEKNFSYNYQDIKGIQPETCSHHIYTRADIKLVRQPQRQMNPTLRYIVKEELQKLLNVNFI